MKKPIALLVNDLHADKDKLVAFQLNWDEALEICESERISNLIIGGDLFTTRANQTLSTLITVWKALKKAYEKELCVTISEGNHDKTNLEEIYGYSHLFQGFGDTYVVDEYDILYWDDCDFVLIVISYFPENNSFLKVLDKAVERALKEFSEVVKDKSNIILYLHEGIHGALGDFEIPGELPQEPFLDFRKVLCGHYHNRIRIKNTPIEYIGASRQHSFGEDEEKGYTILYSDGSTQFIKNVVNTRYKSISLNADELDDFVLQKEMGYKYKLKLNCNEKDAKIIERQKLLDSGFDKVEFNVENKTATEADQSDITERYDKAGIVSEYQTYCDENSIDCKLGLKYLTE